MAGHDEDATDLDVRMAALKRNISLQRGLIESLPAGNRSIDVAARMLQRLEARLSKLEAERDPDEPDGGVRGAPLARAEPAVLKDRGDGARVDQTVAT